MNEHDDAAHGEAEQDELSARLAALPRRAPPPEIAARLAARPRQIYAREAARRPGPIRDRLRWLYPRAEAGLAGAAVVVYLSWAIRTAIALL